VGSDQTVYIGTSGGWFYAIDPDGTEKWALELGGYTSPAAIAEDGTIYVGSTGGTPGLHAVDPDGSLLWTFPAERGVTSSPAIGEDGTVYVGSRSGVLLALHPDGTERWRFALVGGSGNPTGGNGTSPALGDDGAVYVGSNNGYLYAVAADGTLRWSLYLGDEVFTPPAIGPNGWIYVGDEDSRFWALSYLTGGTTGLADSAWPRFRHDARNTGNVSGR
jgi:outer membrane protein assembly factor BamB